MMKYELLDHTADLLMKAGGSTIEECFENAAYAMFDQMVDISTVKPERKIIFRIGRGDLEEMLFDMLSELLYLHDAERMVFSRFEVRFTDDGLECTAWGEYLDTNRHRPKKEIKAVTYHMIKVDPDDPSATVLFDI